MLVGIGVEMMYVVCSIYEIVRKAKENNNNSGTESKTVNKS